jgi:hypothetical protein
MLLHAPESQGQSWKYQTQRFWSKWDIQRSLYIDVPRIQVEWDAPCFESSSIGGSSFGLLKSKALVDTLS